MCYVQQLPDAFEHLHANQFGALLLDPGLPEYCGLEGLREARCWNRKAPIFVLTGLCDEKRALKALEQGAQGYLIKGEVTDSMSGAICYAIQQQKPSAASLERQLALESRAHFAAIVEYSDDAIISETRDGHIVSWNQGAERMYGYSTNEVLGRTISFLLPPEDVEHFRRIRVAVQRGVSFRHFETVFVRKDGRRIDVSLSVSPIKDDEGQVIGISKIARDVSERKKAESAHRQLESERNELLRRLQLQIERMPLAYVLFDADFRVIDWNPSAERIFGYCKDEVLGMGPPFEKLVPKTFEMKGGELLQRIRSGEMSAHSVNDNLTKDGRTITCEWFNTPLLCENGDFKGLMCLARDISQQKQFEQALRDSQERFELAIRGTNDGLGDWNLETGEAFWSPRLREIFGYAADDLEFENNFSAVASRMHPEDRDRALAELAERTHLHQQAKWEFRVLTKNGEYRWVQARGQAVYDENGKAYRFAGALTDISERKQMEEELAQRDRQIRQSNKLEAVGSLAGGIAHEFNNLLQAIRGYGQYAMQGLLPAEQRYQDLEQVIKASDQAAILTRQLLGFSRRQVLERETFDHRDVVTDLVKLLRPIIGEHIELEVCLAKDVGPLHADRGLLQQMLLNLCINARDAMPFGGRMTLSTQRTELSRKYCELHPTVKPGDYLLISVSDTGCGMSPEVKERIFEPFFTTKSVGEGTGLGLAMVYGVVQQHEGMVNVYSEVGLGTTFKIYLPITTSGQANATDVAASPAVGGHETILVAEDESIVRDLAVRVLTDAGYSVLAAANGAEAVEQFESHADVISLAILDAVMPKLTGHQVYDRIKQINPNLPVMFCTGYDPEMGQVKFLTEQGLRLVQKPYDPNILLLTVREGLDAQHLGETVSCNA